MIHEVKGCASCPFNNYDYGVCVHPAFDADLQERFIYSNIEYPDWCPLNKESITIELKK